ncbi:MAG: hypothetical protein SFV15_19520 [Polyangiaceae bacterium]|nr:hypothetical protein [Polyangiaceae bacterium]
MRHPLLYLALSASLIAAPRTVRAALPGNGERIETNSYAVDLFQGPVVESSRAMGLGGAYTALAQGVDGIGQNPAAPAARPVWSFDRVDWDLSAGITFPSTIANSDFFNTGKGKTQLPPTREGDFVFVDIAGALQIGPWGLGAATGLQQYSVNREPTAVTTGADGLRARISFYHLDLAYAALNHQLMFGVGIRGTGLSVVNQNVVTAGSNQTLFATAGNAPEVGVILSPTAESFRLGAAFQGAVTSETTEGKNQQVLYAETDPMYLPSRVSLPWTLNLGAAYQFGGRPLNPRWYDPQELVHSVALGLERRRKRELAANKPTTAGDLNRPRGTTAADRALLASIEKSQLEQARRAFSKMLRARFRRLPRDYVLVSAALQISGASADAVGVEAFLSRTVNRSGQATIFSPRIGVESEPWPYHIKVRVGSYIEPTRFRTNPESMRIHGTLGADFNVLNWSLFGVLDDPAFWRIGFVGDIARDYFASSIGIGFWH